MFGLLFADDRKQAVFADRLGLWTFGFEVFGQFGFDHRYAAGTEGGSFFAGARFDVLLKLSKLATPLAAGTLDAQDVDLLGHVVDDHGCGPRVAAQRTRLGLYLFDAVCTEEVDALVE